MRAPESGAFAVDVTFFKFKFRAHPFQRGEVQIHGTRADGAAPRHGDAGHTKPGQQRAETQHRGAHGLYQIIGRFTLQGAGRDLNPAVPEGTGAAQNFQQPEGGVNIPQVRDIGEDSRSIQQNGTP